MTIEPSNNITQLYCHAFVGVFAITLISFIRWGRLLQGVLISRASGSSNDSLIKIRTTEISEPQLHDILDEKSKDIPPYSPAKETWRCACEGGFLPPSLLKSFGGMESAVRLGLGQCYHKS